MKIEVSLGEAIDKLSILEIKLLKIVDENKKIEIQKEIDCLNECEQYKLQYELYYNMLMGVNTIIWDLTDYIKSITPEHSNFADISNKIFEFNQKRFRIKNMFNIISNSFIKEQKSYSSSCCNIIVDNEETFFNKLPELNYLSVEYDIITFESPIISTIKDFLKIPNVIYDIDEHFSNKKTMINLNNFCIPDYENRDFYCLKPIKYLIGGKFGDFIQTLSVINEKFYDTGGRKGIIYLSERGDTFINGLITTYNDTYDIIIKQYYIHDFKIYNNDLDCVVDLCAWRTNPNLFNQNIYYTYSQTYNIEWGKRKWLTVPFDEKWKNKIIINTTNYRWSNTIDYKKLKELYKDDLIFIYSDESHKDFFKANANIDTEYYRFNTFLELTTIINSCKLFIGGLSAPLAIAHALHKNRICGLCDNDGVNIAIGLDSIFPNLRYSV